MEQGWTCEFGTTLFSEVQLESVCAVTMYLWSYDMCIHVCFFGPALCVPTCKATKSS